MGQKNPPLDNYSHSTVPDSALVSGWYVANIINGVAVAMPAFLVGAKFMTALGAVKGTAALLTGGLILAFIASANMYVACKERTNTVNFLDRSFGRGGQVAISVLISGTLLGWYGVTASLFGSAAQRALEQSFGVVWPAEVLVCFGSLLMVVTTIYGFRAIDMLSRVSVPLMAFILVFGAYRVLSDYSLVEIFGAQGYVTDEIPSFYVGVSIVVGAFMAGVVMLPDLARFVRRSREVIPASLSTYGSFAVLVMAVAGLPALMTGEPDLIVSMYQTGLGLAALVIMVLASWTTNVSNLYSAELGLAQLFPATEDWKLTAGAGVFGTLLAIGGILDHIFSFLYLLGIFIPPISGIYLSHFAMERKFNLVRQGEKSSPLSMTAVAAWCLASFIAYLTSHDYFVLTAIPALDSWLCALVIYSALAWSKARSSRHAT